MDRKTIKWANNYGLPLEEIRYVKCPMNGGGQRQKMDNVRFLTTRRKKRSKTRRYRRK